jgi:predicted dehydrogenase
VVTLGIVGCGDVAFRTYLPGLEGLRGARVVACCDADRARAEQAAQAVGNAEVYTRLDELLARDDVDAVVNLTPAPAHAEVTSSALDAGRHVFSEKPIALTLEEADALIELATARERLLLCAPAIMATPRFRWLRALLTSDEIGRPILGSAHFTSLGAAAWREYTGDPAPFFRADVGPVLDLGVYVLHGLTGLLGPARRLEAFGSVTAPSRVVEIDRLAGQSVDVGGDDQVLIHLDFGDGVLAQVLTAFTVAQIRERPAFEIYGTKGTVSVSTKRWYDAAGPVDVTIGEERPRTVKPHGRARFRNMITVGVPHLVACLDGQDEPVLTADHARHVLEIAIAARRSTEEGRAVELTTTF